MTRFMKTIFIYVGTIRNMYKLVMHVANSSNSYVYTYSINLTIQSYGQWYISDTELKTDIDNCIYYAVRKI